MLILHRRNYNKSHMHTCNAYIYERVHCLTDASRYQMPHIENLILKEEKLMNKFDYQVCIKTGENHGFSVSVDRMEYNNEGRHSNVYLWVGMRCIALFNPSEYKLVYKHTTDNTIFFDLVEVARC